MLVIYTKMFNICQDCFYLDVIHKFQTLFYERFDSRILLFPPIRDDCCFELRILISCKLRHTWFLLQELEVYGL